MPRPHQLYSALWATLALGLTTTGPGSVAWADSETLSQNQGVFTDWRPYAELPARERAGIAPYCPGGFVDPLRSDPNVDPNLPDDQSPLYFNFDESRLLTPNEAHLVGNVNARQNSFQFLADEITYQRSTGTGELTGNVQLRTLGAMVGGNSAQLDLDQRSSDINEAYFALHDQDLHGNADRMSRQGDSLLTGQSVAFTRCMPQDPTWQIRAARFEVNRDTGIAKAWHARFQIQSVPVLYVPYVSFPIDDRRRSGFLTGTYGLATENPGFNELSVPYYLNLAPNYDDTFTLHYYSDLGLLARNEFRFLTEDHNGVSDLDIQVSQPNDTLDADTEAPRRWAFDHRQSGQLGDATGYDLSTRWVSDIRYDQNFNDGGDIVEDQTLNLNLRHQIRTGTLRFGSAFTTPVQDSPENFQTAKITASTRFGNVTPSLLAEWQEPKDDEVTAASHALKRLPEVSLRYNSLSLPGNLNLGATGTYSLFSRQLDTDRLNNLTTPSQLDLATDSQRFYLNTRLSYPLDVEWGYLRPELEGLALAYQQSNSVDPQFSYQPDEFSATPGAVNWRTTVDSRLIAERPFAAGSNVWVHSLEPRLHYTYTPFVDQSDLPDLNTSPVDNDFALFSKSRFSGLDRFGDMNRLSAALDTRLRDKQSGRELAFFGVSKGIKLSQERVGERATLDEDPDFSPEYSPNYLDARWAPSRQVAVNASAQFEHESMDLQAYSLDVTFLPNDRRFIRLAVSGDRPDQDESPAGYQSFGASGYWTVRENLALIGYANWSRPLDLEGNVTDDYAYTDLVYGIDYDSCCWNLRLVGYNSVPDEDEDTIGTGLFASRAEQGVKFEVTLKGLGGSTGNVESLLDEKVPGYRGRLYNYR
ncbi:LPS-assembly protein LptD [Saccharospirillum impatiens]|uniref:LPS-assembly protein LptD n=1 Tax=Saccharospirillum impatiens TaxID=169438 RepID=UPI00040BD693|nr:LPS assembly protein LptD [Saccharospirillum impatiens]